VTADACLLINSLPTDRIRLFCARPPSDWWSCLIGLLTLFSFWDMRTRELWLRAGCMQIYGFLRIKIAVIEFREWSRRYTRRRRRQMMLRLAFPEITFGSLFSLNLNLIDAWGEFLPLVTIAMRFWSKTISDFNQIEIEIISPCQFNVH
jgi:hypothetical protein